MEEHEMGPMFLTARPPQEPVTFRDVAVDFTWEEWAYLDTSQKQLYWEVMLQNFRNLIFVGLAFSNMGMISQLESVEANWIPVGSILRTFWSDWDSRPPTKKSTPKMNISMEDLSQEMLSWDDPCLSKIRKAWKCYGRLKKHYGRIKVIQAQLLNEVRGSEYSKDCKTPHPESVLFLQQGASIVMNLHKGDIQKRSIYSDQRQHSQIYSKKKYSKVNKCHKTLGCDFDPVKKYRIHAEKKFYESGNSFLPNKELTLHQRRNKSKKSYELTKCGKTFCQKADLAQNSSIHSKNKSYKCSECGKAFHKMLYLTLHYRIHTREKPFECNECGKVFTQNADLSLHKTTHAREKSHKCNECGKTFATSSNLSRHRKTHTGIKPHECGVCGKAFSQKSHLNDHISVHSGEKPYKCPECGKIFRCKPGLKKHHVIHTREKPFKCNECGKAFPLSTALTRHERTHTGEKPYECTVCGKAFTQTVGLSLHKRIHAREKPCECNE